MWGISSSREIHRRQQRLLPLNWGAPPKVQHVRGPLVNVAAASMSRQAVDVHRVLLLLQQQLLLLLLLLQLLLLLLQQKQLLLLLLPLLLLSVAMHTAESRYFASADPLGAPAAGSA